jgi:hypothetical protein
MTIKDNGAYETPYHGRVTAALIGYIQWPCCAVLYELVGYSEGSLEVIFGIFECYSIYHAYMSMSGDERGEVHNNMIVT